MRRRNKLRGFKGKKQLANNSRTWRVCSMSSTLAFSALTHFITNSTHSSFRRLRTKAVAFPVIKASSLHEGTALFNAAKLTVDTYVKSGMTIGLGSGQASALAIQYMGRQLRSGALKDILGIPMSVASASEAAKSGIPLDRYQDNSQIDFAFDDADVVEEETLVAVIGQRKLQDDESIIEEKSILNAANTLVFMVGEQQYKSGLECSIPILIQSLNWMNIAEEIDDLFLGDAEVWRRPVIGHAGPSGGDFPLITREGHNILDLIFTSPIESLGQVAESLDKIDGVVGHGVISKSPCTAVIVSKSGLRIVDNVPTNEIRIAF